MLFHVQANSDAMIQGLFGLGDIPKWLGAATEKVVAMCLV
jgi:hypothetical protein